MKIPRGKHGHLVAVLFCLAFTGFWVGARRHVHAAPDRPSAKPAPPVEAPPPKPRDGVPILGPGQTARSPASGPASRPTSQPTSQPASGPTSQATSGATSLPASRPTSLAASRPSSLAAVVLPAWAPKLRAIVRPAVARVGDPIKVVITVTYKKGVSVTLPLKLELGEFGELSRQERHSERGPAGHIPTVEHVFELAVAAYKLGELELPPIEVNALGPGGELVTLKTRSLPLRIVSVMANEPTPKLKQVAPPVRVFQRTYWLLYLLLVVVLIGITVLVTLLVRRRLEARRRAERPPPPPPPPHDVALRRLAGLDVERYIAEERYKDLYLELSEIIREYVGGRWGFDALEMTTTEINETLDERRVAVEVRGRLQTYFNDCDLVKFARYRPQDESARAARAEAEALVHDTTRAWGPLPTPEPDAPTPDVPEPDVPEPDVPEPDVPEPDVPEPDVPEPDVPEPDVPKPDVPKPDDEAQR